MNHRIPKDLNAVALANAGLPYEAVDETKETMTATNTYENYVAVMLGNGMHFTGELIDPTSSTFGRVELRDAMIVQFLQSGEMGLQMHPFGDQKLTLYPILIVRFSDLPNETRKGVLGAYAQKHGRIQLVRQ